MRFVSSQDIVSTDNLKIDVWAGSSKWKKARIIEKYLNSENKLSEILISFEGESSNTNEIIPFDPLKIARYGFYSTHQ